MKKFNFDISLESLQEFQSCCSGFQAKMNEKKYLPLWMHAIDTYFVMLYLFTNFIPKNVRTEWEKKYSDVNIAGLLLCLAILHDIGKACAGFQQYLHHKYDQPMKFNLAHYVTRQKQGKTMRHDQLGELILALREASLSVASVIGAHHGVFYSAIPNPSKEMEKNFESYFGSRVGDGKLQKEEWENLWDRIIQSSCTVAGISFNELQQAYQLEDLMLFTGLVIMADWLASNEEYFPLLRTDESDNLDRYPNRAVEGLKKINLPRPWASTTGIETDEDFSRKFSFPPNSLQKEVTRIAREMSSPGLMVIESDMGSGKTEAAMAAANILGEKFNLGGLVFGLPTQATANGMFPRVMKWASSEAQETCLSVRLAHGKAFLNDTYTAILQQRQTVEGDAVLDSGLHVSEWLLGPKRALLSDIVVSTIDQVLLAGANVKFEALRHIGAAGKVVILDEVHSNDFYMEQFLKRALAWFGSYRIPVILLSATLPSEKTASYIQAYAGKTKYNLGECGYPRITWVEKDSGEVHIFSNIACQKEREVKLVPLTDDSAEGMAELVVEKISDGGTAGIIVNTIKKAQAIYDVFKKIADSDTEVILFHSRFTDMDRAWIEKRVLERVGKDSAFTGKCVIIATQVLEQSLDISLDFLITELCPVDLLLQRIGRYHRHEKPWLPEKLKESFVYITGISEGSKSRVYSPYLLIRTLKLLEKREFLLKIPADITAFVEETYKKADRSSMDEEEWELYHQWELDKKKEQQKARYYLLNKAPKNKAGQIVPGRLNSLSKDDPSYYKYAPDTIVRNSNGELEVILLQKTAGERFRLVSKDKMVSCSAQLTPQLQKEILLQKIRFPQFYAHSFSEMESELLQKEEGWMKEWKKNGFAVNQYFLLLDETSRAVLGNRKLVYSSEFGLREEREDGREEI